MKKDGGWIFISHSHADIGKVRHIRNRLEDAGYEPLLFFLKCLSDTDEIDSLIKREINEREWFIYVDSTNARASKWVCSEREYIRSLTGKKVFEINLDGNLDKQIDYIIKQLKIFISCSAHDLPIAEIIKKELMKKEFLVFSPEDIPSGVEFQTYIRDELDSAIRDGFVLLLITENMDSNFIKTEIEYTVANNGKIIPVYVGKNHLSEQMLRLIGDIRGIFLDANPTQEQLDSLVDFILHNINFYKSDFTS